MILPEFDTKRQRWDQWRAFHIDHGPFTQFDTGELVLNSRMWGPDLRRAYRDLGVTIVSSEDEALPQLTLPDHTFIKRAWLYDSGQQTLLIDESTKRVVRIDSFLRSTDTVLPTRFAQRQIEAYFAGPGRPPVGNQIAVSPPYKLSKDEKDYLATLRAAAKMWWEFGDDPNIATFKHTIRWDKHQPLTSALLGKTFADLKDNSSLTLAQLNKNGYQTHRVKTMYDYLLVA